jgi:RNA polymerase sigma factor (sigma-70 family)
LANIKSIDHSILLENCLLHKEWAQKELYDLYSNQLFAICCRYAKDNNEAKDILQEGFIRVFTNLKQYRGDGALIGWMKRVIITTALNYIKKHKKDITREIDTTNKENYGTVNETESSMDAKDIMQAFMHLPYAYRTILGLHIIEGYTYKELSNLLHIEESSCRTKVHRGKQMLQKIITKLNTVLVINT